MSLPLQIVVTADTNNATTGLKNVQTQLEQTAQTAQKTSSSFSAVAGSLSKVGQVSSQGLHNALRATINDSAQVGEGFARIAGEALGALGPIGLLIGIFAVPKIVAFAKSLFEASDSAKLAKANFENLNTVMQEADKDAGKQIANLKILYSTTQDISLSTRDRLNAVKELQKEFPDYFGNISKETILNGGAEQQYTNLSKAILKSAQARSALSKIEGLSAQLLDNEYQKQKILNATTNETNKILNATYQNTGIGQSASRFRAQNLALVAERKKSALDLVEANSKILQGQIDFLTKFAGLPSLAEQLEKKDKIKSGTGTKITNQFEIDLQALQANYAQVLKYAHDVYDANTKDAEKNGIVVNEFLLNAEIAYLEKKLALDKKYNKNVLSDTQQLIDAQNKLRQSGLSFQQSQIIPSTLPPVPNIAKAETARIDPKIQIFPTDDIIRAGQALEDLNEKQKAVANFTAGVLTTVFDSFSQSVVQGTNLVKSFGDALLKAIEQLAIAIIKSLVLKSIVKALNPLGSLFGGASSVSGFLPGFAGGVNNFGGGLAIVGENGPEVVSLPRGSSVIPNNQIGSANISPQIFIADSIISGANIVLSYNRQSGVNSRNG